jgi:hypothetical protein
MDNNTHGAFIAGNGLNAFVDGIPDTCDHNWDGDTIMQSASSKMIYWHTYRKWASFVTKLRTRLVHRHHEEIEDPIVMETVSCSKCKKVFSPQMFDE